MKKRIDLIWFSLIPVILIVLLFFITPLAEAISESLYNRSGDYVGFDNYTYIFTHKIYSDAFWYTLKVSLISTLIAMILAVIFSLALRETFVGRKVSLFVYQLNVSIPNLVVATMMIFLLAQTGFISRILENLGLISAYTEFPLLLTGESGWGVIISYSWKFFPFIGLAVLAALQTASVDYEDQSKTLGVGKIRTFIHITLPSIIPALLSSSLIVFAFAFGSYELPSVVGTEKTLSLLAYSIYYNPYMAGGQPLAYAIVLLIAAVVAICSLIYLHFSVPRTKVRR